MARIRTLKPEILEDEKTSSLSDSAFRMFVSMVVLADDYGNVRGNESWLRGVVWWAHRSPPRISAILREVFDAQLVDLYVVRGEVYAHLRGWEKHQRVDNAGKPRVPRPDDEDARPFFDLTEDSRRNSATRGEIPLDPDLRPPTSDPEGEREREAAAKPQRKKPSTQLPPDWSPELSQANEATQLQAASRGVSVDAELAKFHDYAKSQDWRKADWNATWRNWLRNAKPNSNRNHSDGFAAVLRMAKEVP